MRRTVIEPITIWDGHDTVLSRGRLVIDDTTITALQRSDEPLDNPPSVGPVRRIDGDGKLALPGLICCHTHLYSALARGLAVPDYAPSTFAEILEQLWWRLDKALDANTLRASAQIGAMEAARCGITTLVDHHASPNAIPGSLDVVRDEVVERVGLRGAFCYELSDRDGPERSRQGIRENVRFLEMIADTPSNVAGHFGLHASFTVDDETLDAVASALPDGIGVHIHVAEGPEDEAQCEAVHGQRIIDRLDRYGLLRPRSILAHCLHLTEQEKDRVGERDAIVVHNPRSNMNNAVGTFDLDGFLDRGILTGLGTDGLGANLLAELFTAALLQKHTRGDSLAGGFDRLDALLFRNNPRIAERLFGVPFGRLAPGTPADVVLLDYAAPTPLTADTILGHLLFGVAVHSLRVSDVLVGGRCILREGSFADIDEQAAYAHANEQAERLWSRVRSEVE